MAMVELEPLLSEEMIAQSAFHQSGDLEAHGRVDVLANLTGFDVERLHILISRHAKYTGSKRGDRHSRQLEDRADEIPQGDAGRIPPRAARAEGARSGSAQDRDRCLDRYAYRGRGVRCMLMHAGVGRARPGACNIACPAGPRAVRGLQAVRRWNVRFAGPDRRRRPGHRVSRSGSKLHGPLRRSRSRKPRPTGMPVAHRRRIRSVRAMGRSTSTRSWTSTFGKELALAGPTHTLLVRVRLRVMGKVTGFLEFERHDRAYEPVADRVKTWKEFVVPLNEQDLRDQAARCMNCGIPYCHGTGSVQPGTPGCPVNNQIPDWNDLVYNGNWEEAARNLHSTNNFPEVTGRVCPAPCEASCTLNLDDNPVTIKSIECEIADRSLQNGWVKPEPAQVKTGKKVAVIGAGPAGPRLRAAARAHRPRRARLREAREGRRPAALRHSRLQDGEGRHRRPRPADGSRGRDLHLRRPCRRQRRSEGPVAELRRDRADRRRRSAARSARAGPRPRRHPLRHGLPAAAEPPRQRRAARRREGHPRQRTSTWW